MEVTQQMLIDAQNALHALLTGSAVRVYVDQNGERLEYSLAKKSDLMAYIDWLKSQLGMAVRPAGPMRVWM